MLSAGNAEMNGMQPLWAPDSMWDTDMGRMGGLVRDIVELWGTPAKHVLHPPFFAATAKKGEALPYLFQDG